MLVNRCSLVLLPRRIVVPLAWHGRQKAQVPYASDPACGVGRIR